MKIVALDGGTTNPGDISWEPISRLGEFVAYDTSDKEVVIERAKDADAIIINRVVINEEVLAQLPKLKYIGTFATGYNTIDLTATKARGIPVCNVPKYCEKTVSQMTFALLLSLCNHVCETSEMVKANKWQNALDYGHFTAKFYELTGKTMGIVGYGGIGKSVAEIARAMGMNVLAYSRSPKDIETHSLEKVLKESDVVSIHCALNEKTTRLIDLNMLKLMKRTAFLINTARGAIVDENDLAFALNEGIIAGAGLDVLVNEPPKEDNPLLTAKNCYITPHVAWSAKEARERLLKVVGENLECFINGTSQNRVNL